MDGWMDGWMGGWMEVKAVLRIAYSNQKVNAKNLKTLSFLLPILPYDS
jgi:hypothetical protein